MTTRNATIEVSYNPEKYPNLKEILIGNLEHIETRIYVRIKGKTVDVLKTLHEAERYANMGRTIEQCCSEIGYPMVEWIEGKP